MKAAQERARERRQAVSGAMNLLNPAADRQFAILDGLATDQVRAEDVQLAIEGATQRLALVRDLLDLARLSVAGSETANGQLTTMLMAGIKLATGEIFDADEARRRAWAKTVAAGLAGVVSEKGVRVFVRAAERLAIRNGHSIARAVEGALSQLVAITQPMSSFLFCFEGAAHAVEPRTTAIRHAVSGLMPFPPLPPLPVPSPIGPNDDFHIPVFHLWDTVGILQAIGCALNRAKIVEAYLAQVKPRASDITGLTPQAFCVAAPGDEPTPMTLKGTFPASQPADVQVAGTAQPTSQAHSESRL